jgi:hypothetical protein
LQYTEDMLRTRLLQLFAGQKPEAEIISPAAELDFEKLESWLLRK